MGADAPIPPWWRGALPLTGVARPSVEGSLGKELDRKMSTIMSSAKPEKAFCAWGTPSAYFYEGIFLILPSGIPRDSIPVIEPPPGAPRGGRRGHRKILSIFFHENKKTGKFFDM